MFLIMYGVLMDMLFSIYHHSIHISMSLTTSGAMSSNGSDNGMSYKLDDVWQLWAVICRKQWHRFGSSLLSHSECRTTVHFTEGLTSPELEGLLCSVSGSNASWDNLWSYWESDLTNVVSVLQIMTKSYWPLIAKQRKHCPGDLNVLKRQKEKPCPTMPWCFQTFF
jgi:hypothetical protein